MAFMPFITAGDPDLSATADVVRTLAEAGVDLIEVGFPYSDPIADGPVIQASYTRALEHKVHVRDIFSTIKQLETEQLPPLVAMVSYAIIFRTGLDTFLDEAHAAGFAGLIVPDLPGDEAEDFLPLVHSRGMDLVELISPTTPPARAERICRQSSGFLYCISVAGTTGVRAELPAQLRTQLESLHTQTDLPLAVGFGVSRPEQVDSLRGLADGVIVGSAIVKMFERMSSGAANRATVLKEIGTFAREMSTADHQSAG